MPCVDGREHRLYFDHYEAMWPKSTFPPVQEIFVKQKEDPVQEIFVKQKEVYFCENCRLRKEVTP